MQPQLIKGVYSYMIIFTTATFIYPSKHAQYACTHAHIKVNFGKIFQTTHYLVT